MGLLTSYTGVILLWIGASVALWLWSLLWKRRDQRQRRKLAAQAARCVEQAQPVFDAIREGLVSGPPLWFSKADRDRVREAADRLLRRLQERAAYFDRAASVRFSVRNHPKFEDHPALAEILQIRRDLWAAADLLLVEQPQDLGEAFAEPGAYERCCAEAAALLFKGVLPAGQDPIDLRLSRASEAAARFVSGLEEEIHAKEERERLPSPAEMAARARAVVGVVPRGWRAAGARTGAAYRGSAALARAIGQSRPVTISLRKARRMGLAARRLGGTAPGKMSAALAKTSRSARRSALRLKRRYEFLVEAYRLRARCEAVLKRAPELSAKGRAFVARLELARRSRKVRRATGQLAVRLATSNLPAAAKRSRQRAAALVATGVQTLQRRFGAE